MHLTASLCSNLSVSDISSGHTPYWLGRSLYQCGMQASHWESRSLGSDALQGIRPFSMPPHYIRSLLFTLRLQSSADKALHCLPSHLTLDSLTAPWAVERYADEFEDEVEEQEEEPESPALKRIRRPTSKAGKDALEASPVSYAKKRRPRTSNVSSQAHSMIMNTGFL